MSRKRQIPYTLDTGAVNSLSEDELHSILRGADDLISSGGRSLLCKILKGSKDKKLLALDLDDSPVYGHFSDLTLKEIAYRVDWAIVNRYLYIDYYDNLPLLAFTPQGWDIARNIRSDELLREFEVKILTEEAPFDMSYLKDRDRQMIFDLLDKTQESKDARFIPLLNAWHQIDYKKVKVRIKEVIRFLKEFV